MSLTQVRKFFNKNTVTGTGKPTVGSKFKGVARSVPKVFLSKCDLLTEPDDIKEHLTAEGIKSVNFVEMATSSRPQNRAPRSKSFIVSLGKFEDFQKVMSGAYLPDNVEIKKYYPPKEPSAVYGSFSKQIEAAIDKLEDAALPLHVSDVTSPVYAEYRAQSSQLIGDDALSTEMMATTNLTASSQDQSSKHTQGGDSRADKD